MKQVFRNPSVLGRTRCSNVNDIMKAAWIGSKSRTTVQYIVPVAALRQ